MVCIAIHDTTLRDGEQMPGVVFSFDEKMDLAERALDFGVDFIDIMPSVSSIEAEVTKELASSHNKHISATCRARKEDIDQACSLNLSQIVLFTALSDIHLIHKRRISREQNMEESLNAIDYARECGLIVDFAGEDCTRADWSYLREFLNSISGKIRFFYAADTIGYLTPERAYSFVSRLRKLHKKTAVHMHNDIGLATANTLAAIRGGAECFSGTFMGIGERAGNAPIEEVCLGLKYLYKKELPVKYHKLAEICNMVSMYSRVVMQPHKPIIGSNAFCHESGIHADGVLKHPATYEHIEPELIGRTRSFYFGKHTGRNVLRHFLGDVSEEELETILSGIKMIAQTTKYSFSENEIRELAKKLKESREGEVIHVDSEAKAMVNL